MRDPRLIAEIDRLADTARPHRRDRAAAAQAGHRLDVRGHRIAGAGRGVRLPALADRIAPLIPLSVEHRLGRCRRRPGPRHAGHREVRQAVRMRLDGRRKAGRAALDTADRPAGDGGRAADSAEGRRGPAQGSQRHCIAGRPYLRLRGAGDAGRKTPTNWPASSRTRSAMSRTATAPARCCEAAGLSFLFGMLLGDFTGGGVVVIAARTIVQSAYSRDVEGRGRPLWSRPDDQDRRRRPRVRRRSWSASPARSSRASRSCAIIRGPRTASPPIKLPSAAAPSPPLLDAAEWAALKRICG